MDIPHMFGEPRYIQNNFTIVFPRIRDIRRKANEFEDRLKRDYVQPQIVSVPDELDPQVPRIIFDSRNGFSQIIISQISFALDIHFSPDYQTDTAKREPYLNQRVPILFKLLDTIKGPKPYFCGFTTLVHLPMDASEMDILQHLSNLFLKGLEVKKPHDILVKTTEIVDDRFFSNVTVDNYRAWDAVSPSMNVDRLSRENARERGIRILSDFNDRYAFNEQSKYYSSRDVTDLIMRGGLKATESLIKSVMGDEHVIQ